MVSEVRSDTVPEILPGLPAGLPAGLRNYWYPVLQSEELPTDRPVAFKALGESLVAWRDLEGRPAIVIDRCPHRSIQLSVGRVLAGELQCVLHGLRFDGSGRCTLIPWEEERTRSHDRVAVAARPARELGGYIWAYLGDADAFPPPPLENEVPEELLKPDEFIWFRLPTQVWDANWLLAIDGSDAYHAVVLHTISQSAADVARQGGVPLEDRRIRIVRSSHGIRGVSTDRAGNPIGHGHFTSDVRGERFVLPCLSTNPIKPAPDVPPYASRLWQYPLDETHTTVVRFLTFRARTEAERERARHTFETVASKRIEQVGEEDAWAAKAQGDLIEARRHENLLGPDEDVVKVRRMINAAFIAQHTGQARHGIAPGALDCPV
jgi:phenylpropionate dioxygenase-like ring-hydroxylating dioxygenase large terminal subunit